MKELLAVRFRNRWSTIKLCNIAAMCLIKKTFIALKYLGSDCRTHGGINDRFAWVSPQAALLYFQIPLATMTGQLAISKQTKNPESFLLYSYLGANITVRVTPKLRGLMKLVISSKSTTKFNDGELEKRFCPEDSMTGGFQRYLLNPQARFPWMQRYHPKKLHQSHTAISNVTCH